VGRGRLPGGRRHSRGRPPPEGPNGSCAFDRRDPAGAGRGRELAASPPRSRRGLIRIGTDPFVALSTRTRGSNAREGLASVDHAGGWPPKYSCKLNATKRPLAPTARSGIGIRSGGQVRFSIRCQSGALLGTFCEVCRPRRPVASPWPCVGKRASPVETGSPRLIV
jgi:hypothetical protein